MIPMCKWVPEIFDKYIGVQKPCYVPYVKFTPAAAIAAICKAGGVPVVALPASARGDALTRIVPRLSCPPSVGRGDPVVIVTEHGVADLRGLSIEARAEALIAVASPLYRNRLATDWSAMRRAM